MTTEDQHSPTGRDERLDQVRNMVEFQICDQPSQSDHARTRSRHRNSIQLGAESLGNDLRETKKPGLGKPGFGRSNAESVDPRTHPK